MVSICVYVVCLYVVCVLCVCVMCVVCVCVRCVLCVCCIYVFYVVCVVYVVSGVCVSGVYVRCVYMVSVCVVCAMCVLYVLCVLCVYGVCMCYACVWCTCGVCLYVCIYMCALAERATLSEWLCPRGCLTIWQATSCLSHSAVASAEEAFWSCYLLGLQCDSCPAVSTMQRWLIPGSIAPMYRDQGGALIGATQGSSCGIGHDLREGWT